MVLRTPTRFLLAVLALALPVSAMAETGPAPSDTTIVHALPRIRALARLRDYDRAADAARAAIGGARLANRADSLLLADALDELVLAIQSRGDWKSSEGDSLGRRAIAIRERVLGPDDPGVARSLRRLAMLRFMGGDRRRAVELVERALRNLEGGVPPDDPELLQTLGVHGQMLADLHEYERARVAIERVLAMAKRRFGPRSRTLTNSLNSLANITMRMGEYEAALAFAREGLAIQLDSLPPTHQDLPRLLKTLGWIENHRGNFDAARRAFARALEATERTQGADHPEAAQALASLAWAEARLGDLAGARRNYERALAIYEGKLGPDHHRVAVVLSDLAGMEVEAGDGPRALALGRRALAILEKLGADDLTLAASLEDVGRMLLQFGRPAGADSLLAQAVGLRELRQGTAHPDLARSLAYLAQARLRLGRDREAAGLHERSVAILRESLGPDHPRLAGGLALLAACRRETGDTTGALDAALEAERISREHFRLLARSLPEREALLYAGTRLIGLDEALGMAAGGAVAAPRLPGMWDALIRSRALVTEEMAERRRSTARASAPDVARAESLLALAGARYARLLVLGDEDDSLETSRRRLASARERMEEAERELATRTLSVRGGRPRSREGFDEVSDALPTASALVAYARYRYPARPDSPGRDGGSGYLALVLPAPGRPIEVVPLGAAEAMDSLVHRWRRRVLAVLAPAGRSAAELEASCREAGDRLRRRAWDPIAARIAGAERVLLVPDGLLHLVDLSALPAPNGGYLIEGRTALVRLTAERDLLQPPPSDGRAGPLVAVGGPDFDARPSDVEWTEAIAALNVEAGPQAGRPYRGAPAACDDFRRVRFASLPAAAREARDVARRWRESRAGANGQAGALELTGAAASERAFKRVAHRAGSLHIGTHGFFLGSGCIQALEGARGVGAMEPALDELSLPRRTRDEGNPLRLSGLAFAGANRREAAGPDEEDGVLTAEEIAALNLDGAESAVLSGCDTGLGDVAAGEGVLGLQRAFRIAGARTLVMSLWAVEDRAAQRWMDAFYRSRLEHGRSAAEAGRAASLELLRARRAAGLDTHPFHWAAFVAAGDGR